MEKREPRKGQGVPKETPDQNVIADVQAALEPCFPGMTWEGLRGELEGRDYFAAGMQNQVRLLAEVSTQMLGSREDRPRLVEALAASPVEKVRGVAAPAACLVYAGNLDAQLDALCFTGALDGTWPRELSATELHNLIIHHGVGTVLPRVAPWVEDDRPAIRRLVVEAFRPRGVMLAHIVELKQDPTPLRSILDPLLDDRASYVRKAVANNLNDISKDNPDLILEWASEWLSPDASRERVWIIERALRTLVKAGNPDALQLLGFAPVDAQDVTWVDTLPSDVEINQLLPVQFTIRNPSDADARVLVLLIMDEPGKGKARRSSMYHIWQGHIAPGGTKAVSKKIHFADRSRRPKEPGTYRLTAQVNGMAVGDRELLFRR